MKMNGIGILGAEARHKLHKRVVALRQAGKTGKETAELTGLSSAAVSTIWRRYLDGGFGALEPGVRGRKQGEGRSLDGGQEETLREILHFRTPESFCPGEHLWTRETIGDAAQAAFGVKLPTRTVSNYLNRWGMLLPQAAQFRKWLSAGPEFYARMRQEKAEIFWFTEKIVGNGATGDSPCLRMLTAVNNRGKCRFMLCEGVMTGRVFIRFLSRLCRDTERKICLIATTPLPRNGRGVRSWLAQRKCRITVLIPANQTPLNQFQQRS